MGTRGFITFVVDGEEKTSYQQFDSYPERVGVDVLSFCTGAMYEKLPDRVRPYDVAIAELADAVRALKVVTDETQVTIEDVQALAAWSDFGVGRKLKPEVIAALECGDDLTKFGNDAPEWYQLVRRTQGQPRDILASGYVLHNATFPQDSLWAEYGYVIDLDDRDLEVYVGFQSKPHTVGRFADREPVTSGYFPVRRVAAWPLNELPEKAEFLAACECGEEL